MRTGWVRTLSCGMLLILAASFQTASAWMSADIDLADLQPDANITALYGANTGWRSGDFAGGAMLCADLDSDGCDDIVIGAPNGAPEFERTTDSGLVHIIYGGSPLGPVFDLASSDLTLYGTQREMLLGSSLASGDVNGDGIEDIIIGAPGYSSDGIEDRGAIFVQLGSASRLTGIREAFHEAAMNATGSGRYSRLGASVACGDINGDGMDDVMACGTELAPEKVGGSGPGIVQVAFGRHMFNNTCDFTLNITGQRPGEAFGSSLSCGDLDGDGIKDIIAGAPLYTPYLISPEIGRAYCFLGSQKLTGNVSVSNAYLTITGSEKNGRLGFSAIAVDIDLDMRSELAVSIPYANGGAQESGKVLIYDDAIKGNATPAEAKWTLAGHKPGSHCGKSLAVVELGGDPCLAIGAPESNGSSIEGASAGEMSLIRCSASLTAGTINIASASCLTIYGERDGDGLGAGAASGRRIDGTNTALLVSAPMSDGPGGDRADCGMVCAFWPQPLQATAGPQDGGNVSLPDTNNWKDWALVGGMSTLCFLSLITVIYISYRRQKKGPQA